MSKVNIDLSKFKHVSSDGKTTKLRHSDGHFLVISHRNLGKDFQKQLSALGPIAKEAQTSDQANEQQDRPRYHEMARGGEMSNSAGREVAEWEGSAQRDTRQHNNIRPTEQSASGDEAWPLPKDTSVGQEIERKKNSMAAGGMPDLSGIDPSGANPPSLPPEFQSREMPQMKSPDPEQAIIGPEIAKVGDWLMSPQGTAMAPPEVNPADVAATKADSIVGNLKQQEGQAEQVAEAAHQQAAAQPIKPDTNSPESLAAQGISVEKAGETQKAKVLGTLATNQAKLLEQDVQRKRDIQDQYDISHKKLEGERQAHISDIQKGYIDPNKYWDSHSKVAAGIGMILAGFNPTNRPNAAIEFLNHQMDMNIDAQKQNLGAKQNLLTANLHQFHNLKDAMDMTRVMQADAVKAQLEQAAAKSGSQLAQAAKQSAIGAIDSKYQPIFMQLQIRHMMQNLGNGGTSASGSTGQMLNGLDVVAPEQAKNYRGRYYAPYDIPGGKSIADREIVPADRAALVAHDKFDTTAKTLHDIIQQNRGHMKVLLDPTNPTAKLATQQAMILQSLFREGTLGTVYREGEQPLLDKAVAGNPLSLVTYFTELPKLEGLMKSNQSMKNTTLDSYGLKPPRSMQHVPQAPEQQPVTGKDGKKYIRQGNYMVPVK